MMQEPARDGSYGAGNNGCHFVSGVFSDRYLAQMANNGMVWAKP
jgi:hypothetical protein